MADDSLLVRLERLERRVALMDVRLGEAFWLALDAAYETILPHRELRCIVCDHRGGRDQFVRLLDRCAFGGGLLERYRCPACECVFGPQKYLDLSDAFVERDYRSLYLSYAEADSTASELRTFRSLAPRPNGLYLDWGCAGGKTVARLRGEGWDVWGYEPSAEVTENHVVTRRGEISARFDGIFSNNVIEHFRDPVAQFRDFHGILKENGMMAHSSPCYEYQYASSRFHTLFLLGRSAHVLAERTEFKVTDVIRDEAYINYLFARA
jgi:SAM-dependent methyltransferase